MQANVDEKLPRAVLLKKNTERKMQSVQRTSTAHATERQLNLVEELQRQAREKKRRRRLVFLGIGVAVFLWVSGAFSAMVTQGNSWYESASILLETQAGYPAQTSISNLYQVEALSSGFVALGEEGCVVYSAGGNRLRSIQSGYTNPAITAGSDKYLLYNLAGNELRVESRTQTLYTKTFTQNIMTAAISNQGSVAVVTESERYLANLTMYSADMTELLSYSMTDSEGIPLSIAYASDNTTLALTTVSAYQGQMQSKLYLVSSKSGMVDCIDTQFATPLAIEWVSATTLYVIYDSKVILYDTAAQATLASYAYQNKTLENYAVYEGTLALLFTHSTHSEVVLCQENLSQYTTLESDAVASNVALDAQSIYLVYEKELTSYSYTGDEIEKTETVQSEKKFLEVLYAEELFLFTADEVTTLTQLSLEKEI